MPTSTPSTSPTPSSPATNEAQHHFEMIDLGSFGKRVREVLEDLFPPKEPELQPVPIPVPVDPPRRRRK